MPSPASITVPTLTSAVVAPKCSIWDLRIAVISSGLTVIISSFVGTDSLGPLRLQSSAAKERLAHCPYEVALQGRETGPGAAVKQLVADLNNDAADDPRLDRGLDFDA